MSFGTTDQICVRTAQLTFSIKRRLKMNLQKLFKAQKQLDDHIVKEKGLEGQDLLDKKTLALQVELGELANEWQMFKFWKEDQKANTEVMYCLNCEKTFEAKNYVCG